MAMDKEEVTFLMSVIGLCVLSAKFIKKKNKRKLWVRPVCQKRRKLGFFEKTFKYIKEHDAELFFQATRMNRMQYDLLFNLVKSHLKKSSARKPIEPECRLALTLIYLSQGVSRNYLAMTFRMGVSTVREVILETCQVLWKLLSPIYMKKLNVADWNQTTTDFYNKWQMPNCVGSIDGKHVEIKCPPKSGSKYFHYKGHYSMVLFAFCDANYVFTAVDVGAFGSQSDGGIFRQSVLGKKIFNDELNIPPPSKLPNSDLIVPHYFVGDNTFPLRNNLMRPYPGMLLRKDKEVFNYRLFRAQRVIENAFGILTTRWRVLGSCIPCHPQNADKIVLACVILHNFLKITDSIFNCDSYCPRNYGDNVDDNNAIIEGLWRTDNLNLTSINRFGSNNSTREAFRIRGILTDYFMGEGKVSFQPS